MESVPEKTFSLCLSRACLGKMIVFYIQMAQKDRFSQANAAVVGAPFLIAAKRSDLLRQARDNARP